MRLPMLIAVAIAASSAVAVGQDVTSPWYPMRQQIEAHESRLDAHDVELRGIAEGLTEIKSELRQLIEDTADLKGGVTASTMGLSKSELIALYKDCPECREAATRALDALGVDPAEYQAPTTAATTVQYTTRRVLKTFREPCATCASGYRLVRRWTTETVPVSTAGPTAGCPCGCGDPNCTCQVAMMAASDGGACPNCGRADCPNWLNSMGAAGDVMYSSAGNFASRARGWFPGKLLFNRVSARRAARGC